MSGFTILLLLLYIVAGGVGLYAVFKNVRAAGVGVFILALALIIALLVH